MVCQYVPTYERELIIAANNLEKGIISDDDVPFLHSLSRDLPENMSEKAVHLFPRNLDTVFTIIKN